MDPSPPIPTAAELRDELRQRVFRHFAPDRCRVLGVELRPFSLWHWRTLDLIQSPFAPDAPVAGFDDADVAVAVRLCSLPPGSSRLTMGWWERKCYEYRARRFGEGMIAEGLRLDAFIAGHMGGPAKWMPKESVPVKCPGWLYLAAAMIVAGFPERDVWAKSPGECRAWLAAMDVSKGGTDFLDEHDVQQALEAGHSMEDLGL